MKKKSILALVFFVIVVGAGSWLFVRREIVQNKILDQIVKKISKDLPFEIRSYSISKKRDFLKFEIVWNQHQISVAGKLALDDDKKTKGWQVHYEPQISIAGATPIFAVLELEAPSNFSKVTMATLKLDESRSLAAFDWGLYGIHIEKPKLELTYQPDSLH